MRAVAKGATITMVRGEPTLVCWCGRDLREVLKAEDNTDLALTCPGSVADRIVGWVLPRLVDDEGEA